MVTTQESLFKHSLNNISGWLRYHRIHILAGAAILVLLFSMLTVFAAKIDSDTSENNPGYVLVCGMLDQIIDVEGVNAVGDKVNVSYGTESISIGGQDISASLLKELNEFAKGIGVCVLVATFFFSLSNIKEVGSALWDFVKKLIFLVAGLYLVFNAQEICLAFANVGSNLASSIMAEDSNAREEVLEAVESLKESILVEYPENQNPISRGLTWIGATVTYFGYAISLSLPLLISKISRLIVNVVVWARGIEIILLAVLSPIAFGDMTNESFGTGAGARFIKNFAALSLSGAIIVAEMVLCSGIISSQLTHVFSGTEFKEITSNMLLVNAVTLAQAALVTRSQQIAKTVLGVG